MSHQLIQGSAHDLPQIPDKSINLICTSPPYFSLRRYEGEQEIDWSEMSYSPMAGLPAITIPAQRAALGLEKRIEDYIGHLILCLREWHRILRDDGLIFCNLGDSYSSGSMTPHGGERATRDQTAMSGIVRNGVNGLPSKNLLMVPARFVLAAQAEGWFLRSAIVWAKGVSFIPHYAGSCMPESVQDRPTQSYEMVYMLAKSEKYYFDMESVKEQAIHAGVIVKTNGNDGMDGGYDGHRTRDGLRRGIVVGSTRNLRNVWAINPQPWSSKKDVDHFACWPEALVTPMIKAGTSQHGVCAACGSPYKRVVERPDMSNRPVRGDSAKYPTNGSHFSDDGGGTRKSAGQVYQEWRNENPDKTIGWQRTCDCQCDEVIPATVLDPFSGSATTGKACLKLGRKYIGVDISKEYLEELSPERMSNVQMEMQL